MGGTSPADFIISLLQVSEKASSIARIVRHFQTTTTSTTIGTKSSSNSNRSKSHSLSPSETESHTPSQTNSTDEPECSSKPLIAKFPISRQQGTVLVDSVTSQKSDADGAASSASDQESSEKIQCAGERRDGFRNGKDMRSSITEYDQLGAGMVQAKPTEDGSPDFKTLADILCQEVIISELTQKVGRCC